MLGRWDPIVDSHDPRMHGDPRHHSTDIEKLKRDIRKLKLENAFLLAQLKVYQEREADMWKAVGW